MNKEDEAKLLKMQLEKQKLSRRARSTAVFYDADYWGEYWVKRFGAEADERNPVTKTETDKKIAFINKFFPDIQSYLDVACSFGHIPAAMFDKGLVNSYGADISESAIEKAPARIKQNIKKMSITDMSEFGSDHFDLVTAFDVFEHLYIEEIMQAVKEVSRVASKYVLIRLPLPSYGSEPWLADLTYQGLTREHVSMYPWEFWARRFHEAGKFQWWFSHIWSMPPDSGRDVVSEGWVTFKRRT